MARYRKRPVVIEAAQFFTDQPLPFQDQGIVHFGCECGPTGACSRCGRFWVQTLEGPLIVSDGDWIIRGIKGEYYPCKPDIFVATYELIDG